MSQDEISLQAVVNLFGKRKKLIIGVTFACALIASGISFLLPEVYQSSIILEVGRIYPPPDSSKKDMEFIEEAGLLTEAINNEAFFVKAWEKLDDVDPDKYMAKYPIEAEAFEYNKGRITLPIVLIRYQNSSPEITVDLLNSMAEIIIDRNRGKYEANRIALEISIENISNKIQAIEKLIAIKQQSREKFREYFQKGEISLDDYNAELAKIRSAQIKPVELLFLQASAMNESKLISIIGQIEADLIASIEENQILIAESRDTIAILKLRLSLSTPTRIIKSPILPRSPIKPKKALITIIAASLGLLVAASFVFIKHVTKI